MYVCLGELQLFEVFQTDSKSVHILWKKRRKPYSHNIAEQNLQTIQERKVIFFLPPFKINFTPLHSHTHIRMSPSKCFIQLLGTKKKVI